MMEAIIKCPANPEFADAMIREARAVGITLIADEGRCVGFVTGAEIQKMMDKRSGIDASSK